MGNIVIERECGIDCNVLGDWVGSQELGGCSVELEPLESRSFGHALKLPRTRMTIEGPEAAANILYRKFELRFLSAGG